MQTFAVNEQDVPSTFLGVLLQAAIVTPIATLRRYITETLHHSIT